VLDLHVLTFVNIPVLDDRLQAAFANGLFECWWPRRNSGELLADAHASRCNWQGSYGTTQSGAPIQRGQDSELLLDD